MIMSPMDDRGLEFASYIALYIICHLTWHYFGADLKWILNRFGIGTNRRN